jgi:hypothetical protein
LPVLFCSVSLSLEQKEAKEKEFYSGDYTRITVRVPKHQHKLIIGAGGKTIREIIKETGAKIKIPPGDEDDEEVVIEGSPEAVDQAAERVTKATMFQERVRTPPSFPSLPAPAADNSTLNATHRTTEAAAEAAEGVVAARGVRRATKPVAASAVRYASSLPRAHTYRHWADSCSHRLCAQRRGGSGRAAAEAVADVIARAAVAVADVIAREATGHPTSHWVPSSCPPRAVADAGVAISRVSPSSQLSGNVRVAIVRHG